MTNPPWEKDWVQLPKKIPVPVMGKKQNSVDVNLKKKTDASNDIFCFQNNKDIK